MMPRVGDVVAGKYRIERMIGEGGMGAVFAATHVLTEKQVALKWMRPELAGDEGAVQRFMREAQAAGRINHPNVVDIYDVGEHQGSTFLVMEYLQGESFSALLERGALNPQQAIEVLLPAMRGVAAAHAKGVVHRDLKPDNIFLCLNPDGEARSPKVLDFGISKVSAKDGQLNPRLTRTGAVMGTPYYMSPEQLRDTAEIDERTDVYAFGVILYEALTGRVPFDAGNYSTLILAIATGTPPAPRVIRPEMPEALERVVLRAMAREPEDRYQHVADLARALEPFVRGIGFRTDRVQDVSHRPRPSLAMTTPFASEQPPAPAPKRSYLGIAAGLAGAAVIIAIWAASSRFGTPAPAAVAPAAPEPHVLAPADPGETPIAAQPAAPVKVAPPQAARDAGVLEAANTPTAPTAEPTPAAPLDEAQRPGHGNGHDRRPPTTQPARPNGRTGGLSADEF